MTAAFDSILASYQSTNELIGSLYGNFGDLGAFDQLALQSSIKQAEKIALEEHELQKKLIEAQIEQTEAITEKAKSGDSLITVDGGELQPELEAIMQPLFKSIKIKISTDYENFLLGIQP